MLKLNSNCFVSYIKKPFSHLFYVTESRDWVTKQIGRNIIKNLPISANTTTTSKGIEKQLIHFGAKQDYLLNESYKKVHLLNNKSILTWYHGDNSSEMISALKQASQYASFIHTSCTISHNKLLEYGIPEEKIVQIPLGVDLNIFTPNDSQYDVIREKFGIPYKYYCIGSFQKDGAGWGRGLNPKMVKGPDIFVKVIEQLKEDYDIFVLLSGPARGYVEKELEARNIQYKHFYPKDINDFAQLYHALDLYLITSREEGGPMSLLEAMASDVPFVSTEVGMAPDIIKDGENGFITKIGEIDALVEKSSKVLDDLSLTVKLTKNALKTVKDYSWQNIAKQHYEKMYSKLIES